MHQGWGTHVWFGPPTGRRCFTPGFTQCPRPSLCQAVASRQMVAEGGGSIIIIHIIWQEVAAAEAAVGYSWPEAMEGICLYV